MPASFGVVKSCWKLAADNVKIANGQQLKEWEREVEQGKTSCADSSCLARLQRMNQHQQQQDTPHAQNEAEPEPKPEPGNLSMQVSLCAE